MHNVAEADSERERQVSFVCGLFIAKTISIPEVVGFVGSLVPVIPYSETFAKILKLG